MTLGDLIAKYRAEHHLSQRKFASFCGLSNAYISMLEHNLNPQTGKPMEVGPKTLMAIANAMLLTPNELVQSVDPGTITYIPLDPDIEARVRRMDEQYEEINKGIDKLYKGYEEFERGMEKLQADIDRMKLAFDELERLRGEAGA